MAEKAIDLRYLTQVIFEKLNIELY